ncbi:hypothetical protein J6590_100781 [Homalodisca vitripennis]|nr:hypothetical protein J6590_100781 [Homalodisca vitripennis]
MQALIQRNSTLVDTLNEIEQQLANERLQKDKFIQMFEEHDREKETIISNYEKEIKHLQGIVNKLKLDQKSELPTDSKAYTESTTQTCDSGKTTQSPSPSHFLAELKIRQDQIERSMQALQIQFQTQVLGTQPIPQPQSQLKSPRMKPSCLSLHNSSRNKTSARRNHFSVSLPMAKNKSRKGKMKNITPDIVPQETTKYKDVNGRSSFPSNCNGKTAIFKLLADKKTPGNDKNATDAYFFTYRNRRPKKDQIQESIQTQSIPKLKNEISNTVNQQFSILHQNVRGLSRKLERLNHFIESTNPSILIVTEHGLDPDKLKLINLTRLVPACTMKTVERP